MRIVKNKLPFPHVIIHDFYTDKELCDIWREIDFLSCPNKLHPPEETNSALDDNGIPLKNNLAIHVDDVYTDRKYSSILSINRKSLNAELLYEIAEFDFSFHNLITCNSDSTLLSYYAGGGHYKPHRDMASYTSLCWFYKKPKSFIGGDLYFPDYDYTLEVENNMQIYFMSSIRHGVTEVKGHGRYTLTQFYSNDWGK